MRQEWFSSQRLDDGTDDFIELNALYHIMVTSSNGDISRVTGPLCGEFTGHQRIPHTKASDVELWCFLWSVPEPVYEQTMEASVIWDAIALIMMSL